MAKSTKMPPNGPSTTGKPSGKGRETIHQNQSKQL